MNALSKWLLAFVVAVALVLSPMTTSSAQNPGPGPANFQVEITWETDADVDLFVKEGDGTLIWYGNKNRRGIDANFDNRHGTLHADNTTGGQPGAPARESYSVTGGPAGRYDIYVRAFRDASRGRPTTVTLYYTVGDRDFVERHTLTPTEKEKHFTPRDW